MSFTILQRLLRESRPLALACAMIPALPLAGRPVANGRIEGVVRDINGSLIAYARLPPFVVTALP